MVTGWQWLTGAVSTGWAGANLQERAISSVKLINKIIPTDLIKQESKRYFDQSTRQRAQSQSDQVSAAGGECGGIDERIPLKVRNRFSGERAERLTFLFSDHRASSSALLVISRPECGSTYHLSKKNQRPRKAISALKKPLFKLMAVSDRVRGGRGAWRVL